MEAVEPTTRAEGIVIRQAERTASRVIEGKAVVIVIDQQKLHTLNEVGTFIWERADGRPVSEIVAEVVTEFEVDEARALADTMQFVDELSSIGALSVEAGSGA